MADDQVLRINQNLDSPSFPSWEREFDSRRPLQFDLQHSWSR